MNIGKPVVFPCKFAISLELGIWATFCAVWILPNIPFAIQHSPVIFRQDVPVPKILIPNKRRVGFSSQHFKGQFKTSIRLNHHTIYILEPTRREHKAGFTGKGILRKSTANPKTVKLDSRHTTAYADSMRSLLEKYTFCKCQPANSSPVWPP
ncbi:MAG: hypothetical protein BWY95_02239 [Bacteroidetes bacterium ADurb.BinA104]|nr:MAG: hypothetical protein BWY95_02239 [Bacteroidetes bacterium ADurb.BinA104]